MIHTLVHWMGVGIAYLILGRAVIAAVDMIERKLHGQYGMQFWDEDEQALTGIALIFWPLVFGGALLYVLVIAVVNLALFFARMPVFIAGMAGDSVRELWHWWRIDRPEREAARLAQIERDADDVIRMISGGPLV